MKNPAESIITNFLSCKHLPVFAVLVIATSTTALAGKGGNGKPGGGGGNDPEATSPTITFDDLPGDSLRSDGSGPYVHDSRNNTTVTFSNDGHAGLDSNSSNKTGSGRSVSVDFGEDISVIDGKNQIWTFRATAELEDAGVQHDMNLWLGGFQDNFNLSQMTLGEVRNDVNLQFTLFLHFPRQKQETPVFVKLAPEILDNQRQCEISNPVRVTCTSVDESGEPNEWYVETQDPDNLACVSQDPFGHDLEDLTIGVLAMSFGFTLSK